MAYHGSRILPLLLAAVLVIAGALLLPRAAAGATSAPPISWSPCLVGFECATVDVPLDHDRPHGPSVELALSRLPATDPQRRIGSLFLNPGGPGGSGVDFVQALGPLLFTPAVARYDLVGFDPSGIARSDGWGHTSPLRSTCVDQVVARYLLDGATPAPGTACAQDVPPFSEPPA